MLLKVLFSPSVFEEGQTQKALTFGTAKASTLNPTTMKTSDQCAETSDANHLPTKGCRTIAWAIAADISRLLWQQVLPRELAWWSSPEWVRRQHKERTSCLRHQQEINHRKQDDVHRKVRFVLANLPQRCRATVWNALGHSDRTSVGWIHCQWHQQLNHSFPHGNLFLKAARHPQHGAHFLLLSWKVFSNDCKKTAVQDRMGLHGRSFWGFVGDNG